VTPFQIAKAECANCDSAGNCLGIGIRDDLSLYQFRTEGKCWLAADADGRIGRCPYFEVCVAPLAQSRARAAVTQEQKRAAARLAEGVCAYEMAVMPVPTVKYAKCKSCQRTVHPPQRLCEQCASASILSSKRQHIREKRSRCRKNAAVGALIMNDL
jgi:Rubredoxin-like zinc ribbon domain (DUF35_N)